MNSVNTAAKPAITWIPPVWRLVGLGGVLGLFSWSALQLNAKSGGITVLWPSNGLLLGVLLLMPRRHWPAYIAVGYVVDVAINMIVAGTLPVATYLAACNMVEVLVGAFLLSRSLVPNSDLTQRGKLASFLGYGVILAPAITAYLASFALVLPHTGTFLHFFRVWFTADALGIAIVTPLCFSFSRGRWFFGHSWLEISGLFALLCGAAVYVFWQTSYPLLFLIMPCLLILGLRLRLAGSALGLLLVSVIGGFLTIVGRGPLALMSFPGLAVHLFMFQFFMAISMLVLYILEVVIAESERLQKSLQTSEGRFRLLAEASRDVIVMTDLEGKREYVSPAAGELLGWNPDDLLGGNYHEIVHPDDIAALASVLEDCRNGKPTQILPYRCQRQDGSYLWMEANLRLYHDSISGEPIGFVNVVRDISSRKAAEDELDKAFRLVENLASVDGLTGIANRRCLDEALEHEWLRAIRDSFHISLLLIDVDHFKSYNDLYGHLGGDDCLRQIAKAILDVVSRPADLAARYGGEEFAVVLPNTPTTGALQIAGRIRRAVEMLALSHLGNPHGVVTVSIGCATLLPEANSGPDALVLAADGALYRAKRAGRNRIEVAEEIAIPARES